MANDACCMDPIAVPGAGELFVLERELPDGIVGLVAKVFGVTMVIHNLNLECREQFEEVMPEG
ncbi:MAG: hypothetical protein PWP72_1423 [Thermoanaerobacter sp.]|nr:hypothetical protein [Thermoanaerobacter sp.]